MFLLLLIVTKAVVVVYVVGGAVVAVVHALAAVTQRFVIAHNDVKWYSKVSALYNSKGCHKKFSLRLCMFCLTLPDSL